VTGNYSMQTRLLPAETEVTGPGGNTAAGNFCAQVTELKALGQCPGAWYMLSAVVAHEHVHETRLLPALQNASVTPVLQAAIEALCVPDGAGVTAASAAASIQALPGFCSGLDFRVGKLDCQISRFDCRRSRDGRADGYRGTWSGRSHDSDNLQCCQDQRLGSLRSLSSIVAAWAFRLR
jgi:hypothetical protein